MSRLVAHLGALFVRGVETLLDAFHPCDKLARVLLVTGPLRQGPFQLTVELKKETDVA